VPTLSQSWQAVGPTDKMTLAQRHFANFPPTETLTSGQLGPTSAFYHIIFRQFLNYKQFLSLIKFICTLVKDLKLLVNYESQM
jgi:hypothetical protein